MSEKILVPTLGESITEATISKWLKSKDENVNADEPVVELETDKVNLEVPSPIDGTVSEINFNNEEVKAIKGLNSEEISTTLGYLTQEEVIHRNNLVLS